MKCNKNVAAREPKRHAFWMTKMQLLRREGARKEGQKKEREGKGGMRT